MINNQEINDNQVQENTKANDEELKEKKGEKKEVSLQKIKEEKEFLPIMEKIVSKNNKKEKRVKLLKNIIEEKFDINDNFKPSSLKLSRGKGNIDMNKYKILMGLEPFFSNFNNHMEKKGDEIIKEICNDYKDEEFEEDKIIFRYGDEADRFFLILDGEVSLYFPFTEVIEMNIDEYYIYILRLKRYNEIEMLNNILLLNHGEFMVEFDEGFNMDEYLIKLYNTYLKLKFDPSFLVKDELPKKKKVKKVKSIDQKIDIQKIKNNLLNQKKPNNIKLNNISYLKRKKIKYNDENRFDNTKFPTFGEREIKELVLRIGDEIIETMKWTMPDKIYNIVEEKKETHIKKRIVNIPNKLLQKYKEYNSNDVNGTEYFKRISPVIIQNNKLIKRPIIVMKYLYVDTFKKGQCFGDFCPDSLSLFSPTYLSIAKTSRINLKIHQFHHFRNMTAISTATHIIDVIKDVTENNNDNTNTNKDNSINYITHLISFNKKIFFAYFSKFMENMTFHKKNFLLNNSLFLNTNNTNLIKTYSFCFKEKKIKEGEYIIKERDKLNESNIYIYFIIKGEFQVNCKKTISQLDEIIKLLGHGKSIPRTFPKLLKDLINTPYYYDLIKKPLYLKLNYLNKNDIIGLSEMFKDDEYFNNVQCTNNNSRVYYVDARIIKLLVDSDQIINNNKNIILYHKYEMLSDILLKQRKIYFDSFFNAEKYNVQNIITRDNNNKTDENNEANNDKEMLSDNYTNNIVKDELLPPNLVIIPKVNKIMETLDGRMSLINGSKIQMGRNPTKINQNKNLEKVHSQGDIIRNLGDLDKMLANLSGRFTLKDRRIERSIEFRKKYQEKMEKLEKEKRIKNEEKMKIKGALPNKIELKGRNPNNLSFYEFKRCNSLFNKMFRELPLLPNKDNYIKSEGEYKLIIPYKRYILKKSNSACNINPLAYDDFNRNYNTYKYFNFNSNEKKLEDISKETIKDNLDYIIQLKSDKKLIKRRNNFIKKNDFLTKKLRGIYKGKFDKVLYDETRLKKIL